MSEEEIIKAAAIIADINQRSSYLDEVCGADDKLRGRVEAALREQTEIHDPSATAAFGQSSGIDSTIAHESTATQGTSNVGIGAVIAQRYRLIRAIGEGGMGTVFLAVQSKPVKRQVALKLIRTGMDSRSVLARFDAERQALALMDHPNIARVYDGGTTASGQPFFVMELVNGVPLTDYCDRARLSIEARLDLFVQVCNAVQHAHQKGIIHRDLKPGNVLVTEVDGRPVCKVIDFGVAKATEQRLTDMSLVDTGLIVGTPAYMSPEQADPSSMDIDTRTDVYSLGIMLYELLTGTPPIDSQQFKRGAVLEMLRMVREVEPPKPSTRLSKAEALPNIASNRNIDPSKLTQLLKGELDWVVMKALEKDRTRRYETANGLANDVQRYLANEVVEARPPSGSYRIKKFVQRNKGQVIAASFVVLALILGIIGTAWQAVAAENARANEAVARKAAEVNEEKAVKAANEERLAKEQTLKRLRQIEKSNEVLGAVFEDFDITEIRNGTEPIEAVLAKKLVKAGEQLDGEAVGDPKVVADLQARLGHSLKGLGFHEEAKVLLEEASNLQRKELGLEAESTIRTLRDLASNYKALGELEASQDLFASILSSLSKSLGDSHQDTLAVQGELALVHIEMGQFTKAIELLETNLDKTIAVFGQEDEQAVACMDNLALAYLKVKRIDDAVPLLVKVHDRTREIYGPEHVKTIGKMLNLAAGYRQQERFEEAQQLYEKARELSQMHLGAEHPLTLTSLNSLAVFYQATGQVELAIPLMEEAIVRLKAKRGDTHPETLVAMNNLAGTYWTIGDLKKSIPLFESVLKVQEPKLGRDNPQTQATISNLGVNYKDAGRFSDAIPLLEECYAASIENPRLRHIGRHLLEAYLKANSVEKAREMLPEVLKETRVRIPPESPQLASWLSQFGEAFLKNQDFSTAEELLRECLEINEKFRPNDLRTYLVRTLVGKALLGEKKFEPAEEQLLKGLKGLQEQESDIPPFASSSIPDALDSLIELYVQLNKPEEADMYRKMREAYPARVEANP